MACSDASASAAPVLGQCSPARSTQSRDLSATDSAMRCALTAALLPALLVFAREAVQGVDDDSCQAKCMVAGHCCTGMSSTNSNPSCVMGCAAAAVLPSEAACNATCKAADGKCGYTVNGTNMTFNQCGGCSAQVAPDWFPASARPPPGQVPGYWPPGYSVAGCGTGRRYHPYECYEGCMYHFRPSMKPIPPAQPQPPLPRNATPVCGVFPSKAYSKFTPWPGCTVGNAMQFSNVFSDNLVLQMQPARSAVYGPLGNSASPSAKVAVTVIPEPTSATTASAEAYTVLATVDADAGTWKAILKPHPARGSYTINASCVSGCTGSASLVNATFGDVWYCFGAICPHWHSCVS